MRALHILDHSMPVMSGYSIRSRNIVTFQREIGLGPIVLTSPKHPAAGSGRQTLDGILHYRTPMSPTPIATLLYARELSLMAHMTRRIAQVARAEGTAILHAHSPALNGLPALLVGRRLGLPVVYESTAFLEDAPSTMERPDKGRSATD